MVRGYWSIYYWNVEPMDITKLWVLSLEMLLGGLSACLQFFWFCLKSETHAQLNLDHVTDLAFAIYFISLPWETSGLLYQSVLMHYPSALCSTILFDQFHSIWLSSSWKYIPIHIRIHPATYISSTIINKNYWSGPTGSHTCWCHKTGLILFDRWRGTSNHE